MSCLCEIVVHPLPLAIPAGLTHIPRQIAAFPQFRRAMLHAVGSARHAGALSAWSADGQHDLGVMLLEMWAYVCDVLAFYDEVRAHECYLRTARLEESVHGLVDRLGYLPRPAVAATVELALLADGRTRLTVPAGTAFRSGAFGEEPPQVFELEAVVDIHPLRSRWNLERTRPKTVGAAGGPGSNPSKLLLEAARSAKWVKGDLALIQPQPAVSTGWRPRTVTGCEPKTDANGERWGELGFDASVPLGASLPLSELRLLRPTRSARLWSRTSASAVLEYASAGTKLVLDGVYRDLRPSDLVLVRCTRDGKRGVRWFRVDASEEVSLSVVVGNDGTHDVTASIPATRITLDADLDDSGRGASADWDPEDAGWLDVHYGLQEAGRLGAPAQPTLAPSAPLVLEAAAEPVDDTQSSRFVLQDLDGRSAAGHGALDFATRTLGDTSFDAARTTLTFPVSAYGNVVRATRGETVRDELLGSGDGSQANQQFTLKKAPLTYLPSTSAATGIVSTLRVWVAGRAWREVPSFYGMLPEDEVFVVRLSPEGVATLHFGDGILGARLPTGVDNVVATYRKGAGAAAPPPGSIAQIERAAPRLRSVKQPLPAYGGADAEPADQIREGAPRQALTLGRAVSTTDVGAFAAAVTGVRAVEVRWSWDKYVQRPVIKVWVVGDGDLAAVVRARLAAVTEENVPIAVAKATPRPVTLALALSYDPDYVPERVEADVVARLLAAKDGLLQVEQLGIGSPVYFSRLLAAIQAVPGVWSTSLTWTRGGSLVTSYGDDPKEGGYFDFSAGVMIDGKEYSGG
jgi:hypothetical protein